MPAPDFRTEIEPHHITQFQADTEHMYQERGPKLLKHASHRDAAGEAIVGVNKFGLATAVQNATPFRDNPVSNTPRLRRWMEPEADLEWGEEIENRDMLLQMRDPQSDLIKAGTMAIGRLCDQRFITALTATVKEGKTITGASNVVFPAGNTIASTVGSADGTTPTGLNPEKLRKTRTAFATDNCDLDYEKPVLAVTPTQIEDLSRFVEVTSADFFRPGEEPYYMSGKLAGVMGFVFEEFNALPVASTIRKNFAWLPSAMAVGTWQTFKSDVWPLPGKRQIPYCYANVIHGFVRKHDEGVRVIECKEG